jgi:hypothetical protein
MPMEVPVVLVDYASQRNAARLRRWSAHDIEDRPEKLIAFGRDL